MTMSKIEMCTDHTGKMEGINSISTSTDLNPNCRANAKIRGSICAKCYAHNMIQMYAGLRDRLQRNTDALTKEVLPDEDLPDTTGMEIFRFESFGDLHNEIHLINYMNIVKKNPGTRFTLWTKVYDVAYNYFKDHDVPENFTLILSSLMINQRIDLSRFKALGKFQPGQLKSFTVWDKKFLDANPGVVNVNCGSRMCNLCRQCYSKNKVEEINEILKSDQHAVVVKEALKSPEMREKVAVDLGDLEKLFS